VFTARLKPDSRIKTVHLSDAPSIRRIQGGKNMGWICELYLLRADGQLEGSIQSQAGADMADEEVLADDEQIIGMYGNCSSFFHSLGMIVWRPHQA
jgi:hypothetical protein